VTTASNWTDAWRAFDAIVVSGEEHTDDNAERLAAGTGSHVDGVTSSAPSTRGCDGVLRTTPPTRRGA
jgi:hypothetical protein